ncbi:hypothetical protein VHUM_02612 [Vanrija humicola]|uniref:Major facilitator superfamily (MFS) profile domain-containing protein n=1 Tax=Vanrija humicola TaxID=5417 RepID=A0A7D8YYJ1_VANHU|nr:hypothetical protein VHUM_02612 [Vanrija humicola]
MPAYASEDPDRTATATPIEYKSSPPSPATLAAVDERLRPLDADTPHSPTPASEAPKRVHLTQSRKALLLFLFCLSQFIDVLCYSAFTVLAEYVSADLGVPITQQSWVITSYAIALAAFLLFWGRVSDLYSAKPVFTCGFVVLGLLSLVISFLPDKYSFFVIRGLSGIAGSALIPSSYRLIVGCFEKHELGRAFTIYGMAGAFSNIAGTILGAVIALIPGTGQMANWRWFFRIICIVILPASLAAQRFIPNLAGDEAESASANPKPKWRRLDLPGALMMLTAITLLILGLTLGADHGWRTPDFLVPFLLAFVLFPAFFLWEAYLPDDMALIPTKTWNFRFTVLIAFSPVIYAWWSTSQMSSVLIWTTARHEPVMIAAVRLLPQGVSGISVGLLLAIYTRLVARPRWTVIIGQLFGVVGYVLMVQPKRYDASEYWPFLFPAYLLGSGGNSACFNGISVATMTSVAPEMAGVAGAVLQTAMQVGSAVAFGIQAGLLTVNPGGVANPGNVHASYFFQLGWSLLWLIGFILLYKPIPRVAAEKKDAEVAAAVEGGEVAETK